mgnify:CR=1 FL=1
MTEKFGYANAMAVPKIEKIVLNMGVGITELFGHRLDDAFVIVALQARNITVSH